MLEFNDKGLLIPKSKIVITLDDFRKYFVERIPSETRVINFERYIRYSNDLKHVLKYDVLKQWINGSFVTNTRNPRDIDVVSFIDHESRIKYQNELKHFEARSANEVYGVDAYLVTVFPYEHAGAFLYESDKAYWMNHFSMTRRDARGRKHTKGFIEINH